MPLLPLFFAHALRAFRGLLPAFTPWEPAFAISHQERLGRCGADCPACAIWALEQDRWQAALAPPTDADAWNGVPGKFDALFSGEPGEGE